MWANLIRFSEFHIARSEILLAACTDQLLYNLSLIKLCLACVKQNTAANAASDSCSFLAKDALSDLVRQCPSSLIINFEQVVKTSFSLKYLFHFFVPVVDWNLYKSAVKSKYVL